MPPTDPVGDATSKSCTLTRLTPGHGTKKQRAQLTVYWLSIDNEPIISKKTFKTIITNSW